MPSSNQITSTTGPVSPVLSYSSFSFSMFFSNEENILFCYEFGGNSKSNSCGLLFLQDVVFMMHTKLVVRVDIFYISLFPMKSDLGISLWCVS